MHTKSRDKIISWYLILVCSEIWCDTVSSVLWLLTIRLWCIQYGSRPTFLQYIHYLDMVILNKYFHHVSSYHSTDTYRYISEHFFTFLVLIGINGVDNLYRTTMEIFRLWIWTLLLQYVLLKQLINHPLMLLLWRLW